MQEKLFVITETQLRDVLSLLGEVPLKWSELPHLILQNLPPLEESEGDNSEEEENKELIEG